MSARHEALARFYRAAVEWAGGAQGEAVVDAAADALVDELDTPSLRYLAGATRASADDESREWVPRVIEELGLRLPDRLSPEARIAAARSWAFRFLRNPSDPRTITEQLYRLYVDTDYTSELAAFIGLDDWYDLLDTGVIAGKASEVDRAVFHALQDLAAGHIRTSVDLDESWALSEAGELFPSWMGTQTWLLTGTGVPGAVANGRLLETLPPEWRTRVIARTSMHDLLFTHPADDFPFPRRVRVAWRDDAYTLELLNEVGVVTGDRCHEPNAPVVLASLLAQLVGGETPASSPLGTSTRLVDQRVRNRIMEYLEFASSFRDQRRYQRRVRIAHVAHEVINQWEDQVGAASRGQRRYPSVCSDDEIAALKEFDAVWQQVGARTSSTLPSIRRVQKLPEWVDLREAAATALDVLERRGRMPEDREIEPTTEAG